MPFLGQDWRSPGEQWVKTFDGWERLRMWRLKLFENLNENVIARLMKLCEGNNFEDYCPAVSSAHSTQPHIYLYKLSREAKMQISISDVFSKLDISGAVKDKRRFNYVVKMLELMIEHKLCSLSGSAQRNLLNTIEDAHNSVLKSQTNTRVMRELLQQLRNGLEDGHYYHVGSSSLWTKHKDMVDRMLNSINSLQLTQREEDGKLTMCDLPDECIREILLRMTDHSDLINTGLIDDRYREIAEEKGLWRELCLFHFNNRQILQIVKDPDTLSNLDTEGWQKLHVRLLKRFGPRDNYAEVVCLCRNCNALYWQHHGHPCLNPDMKSRYVPLTPVMCIELFA